MIRRHDPAVALASLLALVCGACASQSMQNLSTGARWTLGRPLPTHDDAITTGTETAKSPWYKGQKVSWGRNLLRNATTADPAIRAHVEANGRPDGIAVHNEGMRITLYYATTGTAYVFEPTSAVAEELPQRVLVETRPTRVDESGFFSTASERDEIRIVVGELTADQQRLERIAYRIIAEAPAAEKPGYRHGFFVANDAPLLAEHFGIPGYSTGAVILYVDPEGPARDVLRPGDLIIQANGRRVANARDYDVKPDVKDVDLVILRDEIEKTVRVSGRPIPLPIGVYAVLSESINAFASEHAIGVTTALMRGCDDDMLAFVVGHEVAHVALKHTDPATGKRLGQAAAALPFAPVLLVPVLGQVVSNTAAGLEDRGKRDQERDADRDGVGLSAKAGFDPEAALEWAALMQRNARLPSITQYFDIHPPYDERTAILRQAIAATAKPAAP